MKKIQLYILSSVILLILFFYPVTAFSSWTSMTSGTTNNLLGVWGSSSHDVFAVGYSGTIIHYNGSTWSSMTSGTTNPLTGIWGSAGNDVFAVDYYGNIIHYNGSTWTGMGKMANYLSGIWGSSGSDVFAVGGSYGTILHYNGSTWSTMTTGIAQCPYLYGVWGSSGSDVYAVGGGGTILHYDGNSWVPMESGTANELRGVWGTSSTNVFAVGANNTILHYDGTTWSLMSLSWNYPFQYLDVWGSSATNVYVVALDGLISKYDGITWSPELFLTPNGPNSIWGSSETDIFVVRRGGLIQYYSNGEPTLITLSSFNAIPKAGKVILSWTTESETDSAGFNIYRAESKNGEYVKINPFLIPAQGSSAQGSSYEFIDTNIQNRKTYYYKLEDIDLNGTSTMHGPVSATPRLIFGIGKNENITE
jgi:hypothetical protein